LRTVLEAPTVARMAERFTSAAAGRPASAAPRLPGTLVEIQAGGSQHPLFLIHPAGGHVLGYRPLAARLGADRPVYGIEARGVAGDGEPHRSIEEMAAAHVATMLAWKPRGPYLLGGASLGGIVAWEMAQQLTARGETPALVVLMDSPGPGQMPRRLRDDAEVICYLLGKGLGLSPGELRELPAEQRLPHALARAASAGLLPAELDLPRARALMSVFKIHVRAMKTYRPRPYGGRVLFFRAAERRAADPPRPEAAWIDLALAGIEVVVVPGDHGSLYQPPHVEGMAAKLERVLAAACSVEARA
jgi:phthiocerol/phenolphthiocerol synthesis type-I polyketide synthase E